MLTVGEIEELLQPLLEGGLMVRDGNSYLSLAVPFGDYLPEESIRQRIVQLLDDTMKALDSPSPVPLVADSTKEVAPIATI
jgi:hypothetical protein